MSQAEDLLNSLIADSEVEEHIIIGKDRFIQVPQNLQKIAVQYDHNVRTVTFDCPRYSDGRDLSNMIISVNYLRPDGEPGLYTVKEIRIDETDETLMHFDWVIEDDVTAVNGTLSFLICAKKTNSDGINENHWNTELNQEMTISKGLNCTESIIKRYPDLIAQILTRLDDVEVEVNAAKEEAKPKATMISLPVSGWTGSGLLYSQTVSVPIVTANSQVELRPSPNQLEELLATEISLTAVNESGTMIVFAIGGKPISDYVMQIIISEVVSV